MHDRLFVRRDKPTEISGGGVHLPAVAQRVAIRGTVLALGDGWNRKRKSRRPFDLAVGDRILFSPNIGTEWEGSSSGGRGELELPGGERVLVVREQDVIGIEDGEPSHLMPARRHARIGPPRVLKGWECEA